MHAIIVRRAAGRASGSIKPAEMLSKIARFDPGVRGIAAAGIKTPRKRRRGVADRNEQTNHRTNEQTSGQTNGRTDGRMLDDDANGGSRLGICRQSRCVFPCAAGLKAGKAMGSETFSRVEGAGKSGNHRRASPYKRDDKIGTRCHSLARKMLLHCARSNRLARFPR